MHIFFSFLSLITNITKKNEQGTEFNLGHSESFYASCVFNGPITHLYTYQKINLFKNRSAPCHRSRLAESITIIAFLLKVLFLLHELVRNQQQLSWESISLLPPPLQKYVGEKEMTCGYLRTVFLFLRSLILTKFLSNDTEIVMSIISKI